MSSKSSKYKDYFTFSRGERNGIIILIILILILIFAPFIYRSFIKSSPISNSNSLSKADSFFASLSIKPDESIKHSINTIENEEITTSKSLKCFFFDPNTVTVEELVQLGLSVKQANVIERYRSKGGRFFSPKDFSKVYVIDSLAFKRLKPWIKIDLQALNTQPKTKKDTISYASKSPIIVELNSTDTVNLVKIKGIGKAYARRIIAYRNLLGGYTNIYQLNEVYGIKNELINTISSFITIDSTKIKLINLNLVSYEDLKKHPYISDYQAKAIIYYRNKVGSIKNINELIVNKILTYDKFKNIRSYLTAY
jgi:competence protein ComEA